MKVKVKDIAKLAGVSPTAVSQVLNDRPCRIAEETREKILRIAKELKYQQENFGIFTGFKKVKSIGLIVPELENPFFREIAYQVSEAAQEYDYTVFQCNIRKEFVSFRNAVECLIGKNVDGVILIPPEQIDKEGIKLVKSLQDGRIPLLLLDRAVYSVFCDFVTADNKHGGRLATEYLIRQGHTRIGIILGPDKTYTARKRLEGYRETLARNQIPIDEGLVVWGDYTAETGCRGAEELFEKGVRAIFASNDCIACGVYRFADEQKLAIGRDLFVIGYDDTEVCGWMRPPLTSIGQNAGQMAEKAVELLIRRIGETDESPSKNYYFTPILVERKSV